MAITTKTVYLTSKGEQHKTLGGAELAEKLDIMDTELSKLLEEIHYRGISIDDLREELMNNRAELVQILNK